MNGRLPVVGLCPKIPLKKAGIRIDPPISDPTKNVVWLIFSEILLDQVQIPMPKGDPPDASSPAFTILLTKSSKTK